MAEEFVNFENALRELKLSEEQLKRLVSEGEIRAVRGDNNSMRFRRDEIERLKQDTGKTLQYMEDSSDTLTDDLLFDEADELDVSDEGMATAQIGDETLTGDAPKPKVAPGVKGKPAPVKGKTPAPAPKGKGQPAKKAIAPPPPARKESAATTGVRRTTGRSTRMLQTQAELKASGIGMGVTAMLVLTFLVGAYSLFVWWDVSKDTVSGVTEGISNWTFETFGGKK